MPPKKRTTQKHTTRKSKTKKKDIETAEAPLAPGMQQTRQISKSQMRKEEPESQAFTPGETGQPEQDPDPEHGNPQGVQSGRGPLKQEGEGNRQNDELAELEDVEPTVSAEQK